MSRIFITGLGIISPLGDSVGLNHLGLREGKCAISDLAYFDTRYASLLPFGEVKVDNIGLKEKLKVREAGVTRTALLALHAFEEAIKDSTLTREELTAPDTALIGANTVGGMCLTDELYNDANSATLGSEYISSYDAGSVTIFLQKRYGLNGPINTINTACSSSANAIMFGARLIRNGFAKRAIVGGTDSLAKFTINGFNALHILSPEICRPFDKDRKGLNLGEGAGFLILEGENEIKNKKVYAEITGWSNVNDSFHPSSLSDSGEGPYQAMKGALKTANLEAAQISFINTHGTGTENNDEVESKAMIRVFKEVPAFTSTKSNIGHTLGASGAIEAVYSVLSLEHQEIYPSLHFQHPIPESGLTPIKVYQKSPIKHIMSNSFGFGGNCTSLIFSKV